jgi:membrane-anchored protein YejM (alkaline phosphatase superfamily)
MRPSESKYDQRSSGNSTKSSFIKFFLNFSVINLVFLLFLSLAYLFLIPVHLKQSIGVNGNSILSYLFLVLAVLGQVGLINISLMLCLGVVILGLRYLFRSTYYDFVLVLLTSFFMSILVIFLVLDISVYHLMGYHLTRTFWNVLFSGVFFQVIVLSNVEWITFLIGFFIFLMAEVSLAAWLWQKHYYKYFSWLSISLGLLICSLSGFSYTYYFFNESSVGDLPQLTRVIPYFSTMARMILPAVKARKLKYPHYPLVFNAPAKSLNILMIVIDTWRSDMLTKRITPNIWSFAQQSLRFDNHYSGGNFTRPGIFSLLYGLTPNYWHQMLKSRHGPVLIHQLIKDDYAMEVLPSASPRFPDFVDTAFHDVPSAWQDTAGINSTQRDLNITNEFESFIASRKQAQPFFGFLFYDAVHNWCGSSQAYAKPFQPAIQTCNRMRLAANTNPAPYLNRYKNAAHYDDQLIGNIVNDLRQHDLLKNTVVIITADHGEEFNDSHRGLWGHGSAFDQYQLHIPFIMHWPGIYSRAINYRTSHYDVVPTLMKYVLGCQNSTSDYSDGVSLFSKRQPPDILVGSYGRYAYLYSHTIDILFPGGYSIRDPLS